MPAIWHEASVIHIQQASPTTKRFWLSVDNHSEFQFQPGQFITLDLPTGEKRRDRWRSYSIANPPNQAGVIELCIVFQEQGLASEYFFKRVKRGTRLRFKKPAGTFTLPLQIDRDLVFICTGTGVTPFRSMLWHLYQTGRDHRQLHLIFGTRNHLGILYKKEFDFLSTHLPGFRYSIALSRQDSTEYHRGYVHDIYRRQYAGKRSDILFYLCGWQKMIDQAAEHLYSELGYERGQILYELYG